MTKPRGTLTEIQIAISGIQSGLAVILQGENITIEQALRVSAKMKEYADTAQSALGEVFENCRTLN